LIIVVGKITYAIGTLVVNVPSNAQPAVERYAESLGDKFALVKLDKIRKHRSTGWKSQNHHINGHCQQIAQDTGNDFDTVKTYCKTQAISRGYPIDVIRGQVVPWSESRIDTLQASYLIDMIHQLAAELGIILQEE
jgi:hypothetical protein